MFLLLHQQDLQILLQIRENLARLQENRIFFSGNIPHIKPILARISEQFREVSSSQGGIKRVNDEHIPWFQLDFLGTAINFGEDTIDYQIQQFISSQEPDSLLKDVEELITTLKTSLQKLSSFETEKLEAQIALRTLDTLILEAQTCLTILSNNSESPPVQKNAVISYLDLRKQFDTNSMIRIFRQHERYIDTRSGLGSLFWKYPTETDQTTKKRYLESTDNNKWKERLEKDLQYLQKKRRNINETFFSDYFRLDIQPTLSESYSSTKRQDRYPTIQNISNAIYKKVIFPIIRENLSIQLQVDSQIACAVILDIAAEIGEMENYLPHDIKERYQLYPWIDVRNPVDHAYTAPQKSDHWYRESKFVIIQN